ncbi:MAG: hypothetical protein KDA28_15510, partial [Phycisphaerales bacterium]|nr:hypothetical protein [Phycisphaerales bacterium]
MIRSMTGFGEASTQVDGAHYFVEIRSLNNKYFKAVIRLPDDCQGLDAEMESGLRGRLSRGTVTLTASCTDASEQAAYRVNQAALETYIQQLQHVPSVAEGKVGLDVGSLLDLPGVLQVPTDESRHERVSGIFLDLLGKACTVLIEMREREGAVLLEDLLHQRDLIMDRLGRIRERAPIVIDEYERRLRSRIEKLMGEADVDPVDLIREIAVYA